ncbi:fimbrial protein [Klebsiella pneumoniae]
MQKIVNLLLLFLTFSSQVMAAANCVYQDGQGPISVTATIPSITIAAGVDAPLGTVLYRFLYMMPEYNPITCIADSSLTPYKIFNTYRVTSPMPRSSLSGMISVAGYGTPTDIWETGVPGVGVVLQSVNTFLASRTWLPATVPYSELYAGTSSKQPVNYNTFIYLIKTGNISGGTISGAQLPSYALDVTITPSTGGSPFKNAAKVNYTGSVNITTMSCITPDVTVSMGTHDVNSKFNGVGSTTDWKDASIQLTNCPRAFGMRQDIRYMAESQTTSMGALKNNSVSVTLAPANGVIDAANGIFNLNAESDSAEGIGIQIASGLPDSSPQPINLGSPVTMTFSDTGSALGTVKLPMSARYIQTASEVKPGKANGRLIFTVLYY